MALTPEQQNLLYLEEAERAGIHKPILTALHTVQNQPLLPDGETGLGVSPANRISLDQVNSFNGQVFYAANTIRSLTNSLTVEGWKGTDIWSLENGRYTDKFIQAIASGHTALPSDTTAALLEQSEQTALLHAYLNDVATDFQAAGVPANQSYLDSTLLNLVEQIPRYYAGFSYHREALLELVRIWHKLDSDEATIALLHSNTQTSSDATTSAPATTDASLDRALLQFIPRIAPGYSGYPHQREALLQFIQRWQQLVSREAAIVALANNASLEPSSALLDSALIALIQRIPQFYQGKGDQRNALVEGFRLWQQLDQRSDALIALGVNPEIFSAAAPSQTDIVNAAIQLDRALLEFVHQLPTTYQGTEQQRQALIHLTQLWRGFATQEQTIQSLFSDLKQMATARRDTPAAPPVPKPLLLPSPPSQWTPTTIQMYAPIIPNGSFTWAEATKGGVYLPANQPIVDAIVRIAQLIQQVRDRIGRPLQIVRWYEPDNAANKAMNGGISHRHPIGDAIIFYCDGLTGEQLYWFLDSWWTGGLGRYAQFPYLSYVDARTQRTRWLR